MKPSGSLLRRLLLAALILLPIALTLTAWYLERAHRGALDAAIAERLQLQVLSLLAQADVGNDVDLRFLPRESRLREPASGLYAMISDTLGEPLWVSPSTALLPGGLARLQGRLPALTAGEYFDDEHDGLIRHAYQVVWEFDNQTELPLRILVAESAAPRAADIRAFRESLMLGLGVTVLLLIAAQTAVVRWGLAPLRRLAERIRQIEAGERGDLDGPWPREVHSVVESLDALLRGEQQRRERMRHTLSDLAHSLKTPMAVLRSADTSAADYHALRQEQLERMEEVMNWQLQRAVGAGHRLMQRLEVGPVLERLRSTLLKVYAARDLDLTVAVEDGTLFRGDERDLMELLGNLLDNACKYGHSTVAAKARGGRDGEALEITIDDDGDGISPELRDSLLQRGVRADQQREGQGIGLSVVQEIVRAQGGKLELTDSPLGGARVRLTLP